MALRVWLPFNGNLINQGLDSFTIPTNNINIYENGKIGQCLALNNNAQSFTAQSLNGLKQFTVCFWIKAKSDETRTSDWNQMLQLGCKKSDGTSSSSLRFESTYNYQPRACSFHNNADYGITTASAVLVQNKDEWHHVTFCCDATKCYSYVDGGNYAEYNYNGGSLTGLIVIGSTKFYGSMNDLRIYDECLSEKQIKEISKGLVAHYKLDNSYIEKTTNLAPGIDGTTNFTINNSPAWDTTLNGTPMINPSGWGNGYNGGVTDPTHGYHAHWIRENGQWIMMFPNLNSVINQKGRWLGISSGVSTKDILAGEKYTISWWQKTDNLALAPWGGVFYKKTSDGSYNFHDGCPTFGYNTKLNTWEFMSRTFTRNAEYVQHDASQSIYVYGGNSNEGTMYVKDVQIQRGDHATPYAVGTRNGLANAIDYSGNEYHGKVFGTLTFNSDSPRYSGSTYFNGSSYLTSSSGSMAWFPFDNLTISAWLKPTVKPSDWTGSIGIQQDGNPDGKVFSISNYAGNFSVHTDNGSGWVTTQSNALPLNEWSYCVATLTNGNDLKMYINGTLVKTATLNYNTAVVKSDTRIAIGVDLPGGDEKYTGYYSDIKIYATALSADNILTMYKNSGIIDNKGNVYAYDFIENNSNIFESENIQKYTTNRSSNGHGQIVTRAGENAIAINPSTFWQTTETQKGIILRDEIIPNQQYYLDLWIDGDDVVYNNNNVSQGIKIRYTDDSSENLTVIGDQTNKKGFQHIQYITPVNKSVYCIEQTYWVGIPNYYRWDTIICPLSKVNLTQQGVWNTTNISENSNKAKLHMSGTMYSNDIFEI